MWIIILLFLLAIAYPAKWLCDALPPHLIGAICIGLLAVGWVGLVANLIDPAKTSNRLRILRHVSAALFLAAVPMSCSTINYMSADPSVDVLGFQKSTPRGVVDDSPHNFQTRSERRGSMVENLPSNILWLIKYLVSPHGLLSLVAAFVGALPFVVLLLKESDKESPSDWLRGQFWLLTIVATVFFLIVFNRS